MFSKCNVKAFLVSLFDKPATGTIYNGTDQNLVVCLLIVRFQNGCDKVVIELWVVQFWSEIILVISNQTCAACSFDFEITRMISDQIVLHSVQLPLYIKIILLDIYNGTSVYQSPWYGKQYSSPQ